MNYRAKNKLILAICSGTNLYIRDTGVAVQVEYYGTDLNARFLDRKSTAKGLLCNVTVVGTPTTKSLKVFEAFHIKKNSHTKIVETDGLISLEHLSLSPYESKAGKILYDKKGK